MSFFDFPKFFVIFLIRIYQKTLSFDHGPLKFLHPYGYCRFHPTCSEYACQAIGRFGLLKGGFLAFWRVLRCHPWSKGGVDEIPDPKNSGKRGPDDELSVGKTLSDTDFNKILNLYEKKLVFPKKTPNKQFMICPLGLVGSGKTTFIKPLANHFGLVRVSNDEIGDVLKENGFNFLRTKEISFPTFNH